MSAGRPPMDPPALAGYDHVRLLGSGGYSDVFLYEQRLPRRQVAIKVLLTEGLGDTGRQQFYDEANAMAAVSTHPYIVTVLHADVSPDGHPYLVMEYYPRANFSVRARNEQIPVAEVLRTGIQVASAVETAHRAGILHRDIKPANILTSEYNRPGLTDFGIAASTIGASEADGLSIPWAPPEVVGAESSPGLTADVYSLTATIYTLLAGRSPFEVPGGSNRTLDLIQRIDQGDPPPTGRADVPASLERLLRHGMSRSPHDRPSSALELGRMLQAVEIDEGWAATHLEIREDLRDVRSRSEVPDGDGTRLKSPTVVHGQPSRATGPSGPDSLVTGVPGQLPPNTEVDDGTVGAPAVAEGTVMRGDPGVAIRSGVGERPLGLSGVAPPRPVQPMPSGSVSSPDAAPADPATPTGPSRARRSPAKVLGVSALVVALSLVLVAFVMSQLDDSGGDQECDPAVEQCDDGTPGPTQPPPSPLPDAPPTPTEVSVQPAVGDVRTVTWSHEGDAGVEYLFQLYDQNGEAIGQVRDALSTTVPAGVACVSVEAFEGRTGSSKSECVRAP